MSSSNPISNWNNFLDRTTGCIVKSTTACLPSSLKEFICAKYFTQSKSITHGLLAAIWLNGTIGNPWLNRWAAYAASSAVIVPTIGLAYRYQRMHAAEVKALPKSKIIAAIVLPIIFGIAEPIILYHVGMYSDVDFYISFPVNLWAAYGTVCTGMASHIALLENVRKASAHEDTVNDEEPIPLSRVDKNSVEYQVTVRTLQLEKEIIELKEKIKKLEEFIYSNEELKKAVSEALKEYQAVYANYAPPPKDHLNPSDPIDRMTLLALKRNALERDLQERTMFIERNPHVYELFKKHMTSPSSSPTTEGLPLLRFE